VEIETAETEEDRQLSPGKLKEKYIEYARTHFIRNPHLVVVNQKDVLCTIMAL